MAEVHPTAIVEEGAELAEGVVIHPFCCIGARVKIGAGTKVLAHTIIEGDTEIGRDNSVGRQCCLGSPPQDIEYDGRPTRLVVGDGNFFGNFTNVGRASIKHEGVTRIGNENYIMAYVHIGHDGQIGNGVIIANATQLSGHVTVYDRANLSGLVAIHQFVRIGELAMLQGGSTIGQDVPPYALVAGLRAHFVSINAEGMNRAGIDAERRNVVRDAYKILLQSRLPMGEAMARLAETHPGVPEVERIIKFVKGSRRGICPARRRSP